MISTRILNLFALIALATLITTLAPQPVVALAGPGSRAVTFGRQHLHARVAENKLKKRSSSKKCRARPSPPVAPTSSHHDAPQQPTTTAKAPAPTQTHSSGSPTGILGSKLGLAWADGNADYIKNLAGVKWLYTWGATCPSKAKDLGMACLPQLWGWKNKGAFDEAAKTANPPLFLTFNEPQEPGQANMDVGSGVSLWKQSVKPLTDKGHKVCSPATSSNPNGLTWVKNFKEQCPECTWDYTCIHWYDTTLDKFQNYVKLWHETFGKPILITEFAAQNFNGGPQPNSGQVFSFMEQAVSWLNSQSYVIGYAPFGIMAPPTGINANMNMLNGDGSLTALGRDVLGRSGV